MDKRRTNRLVEMGKNVLILALSVSAIYLAIDTLLMEGMSGWWTAQEDKRASVVVEREQSSVAWPVRLAASSISGEHVMRYGVQYDREECELQFQAVASLLREALSSLSQPRTATKAEWQRALSQSNSLYFDLLGPVPLSVLSGWLSGAESEMDGRVRRLALAQREEQVLLYYLEENTGKYYACEAPVVSVEQLRAAVEGATDSGALFAFESEQLEAMEGNTLILTSPPEPNVYTAVNPLRGSGQDISEDTSLGRLLLGLDFPDSSYIYSGTDQVVRSGNDTLRISSDGVVSYNVTEGEQSRYLVPMAGQQPTAFEAAEACRSLAEGTVGAMAGEARLYLWNMEQTQTGWRVDFAYCLNGAHVQVGEGGYAAHFLIRDGEIVQFILQMRSYTQSGESSIVMPERQAMAAMEAMEARDGELVLVYRDNGGEQVSAGWAVG